MTVNRLCCPVFTEQWMEAMTIAITCLEEKIRQPTIMILQYQWTVELLAYLDFVFCTIQFF